MLKGERSLLQKHYSDEIFTLNISASHLKIVGESNYAIYCMKMVFSL